jgi:hypothetical protein
MKRMMGATASGKKLAGMSMFPSKHYRKIFIKVRYKSDFMLSNCFCYSGVKRKHKIYRYHIRNEEILWLNFNFLFCTAPTGITVPKVEKCELFYNRLLPVLRLLALELWTFKLIGGKDLKAFFDNKVPV